MGSLGCTLGVPIRTGNGLDRVVRFNVPPLVEISSSAAIDFRVLDVTVALDLQETFFTILDKFSRRIVFWQMWVFLAPIFEKHLEHNCSTFAGDEPGKAGCPTL